MIVQDIWLQTAARKLSPGMKRGSPASFSPGSLAPFFVSYSVKQRARGLSSLAASPALSLEEEPPTHRCASAWEGSQASAPKVSDRSRHQALRSDCHPLKANGA